VSAAPEKKFVDLNHVPEDWIEITPSGEIHIKNKDFADSVQRSLQGTGQRVLRNNGGCDCG